MEYAKERRYPPPLSREDVAEIVRDAVVDTLSDLTEMDLAGSHDKAKLRACFRTIVALNEAREIGVKFCFRCVGRGVALAGFAGIGAWVTIHADKWPWFRRFLVWMGVLS